LVLISSLKSFDNLHPPDLSRSPGIHFGGDGKSGKSACGLRNQASVLLVLVVIPTGIRAQWGPANDDPRYALRIGMTVSLLLHPTSRYVSTGVGLARGAGYNFDRRNALIGASSCGTGFIDRVGSEVRLKFGPTNHSETN
jgi:hypothetical protein